MANHHHPASPETHGHGHGHGHGHHHHDHGTKDINDRTLLWAIILNVGLSIFQFIGGAFAGSVSVMADALHNTNDAAALVIAYVARKISRKSADEQFTFGYRRAELIGALIQLTALIVVGVYLISEAIGRFFEPESIKGGWVMGISAVAIIVDLGTAWLLWAMSKGNLNLKAAFLHNLTDAAASIVVLLGGAAIYLLDWVWVDPLLTLVIAGYILYMSVGMLKQSAKILMEGTPEGVDLQELSQSVSAVDKVIGLHHLHVWELDEEHRALEAHVVIPEQSTAEERHQIRSAIKSLLATKYRIEHSTLELETADHGCGDENSEMIPGH